MAIENVSDEKWLKINSKNREIVEEFLHLFEVTGSSHVFGKLNFHHRRYRIQTQQIEPQ